jgi:hypothetical protein
MDAPLSVAEPSAEPENEAEQAIWPPWKVGGWQEIKLCLALSTAYFFMFVAYGSSQTLASTLPFNDEPGNEGTGNNCMFIVYFVFTFSCFFAPLLVHTIGAKPCIQIGFAMWQQGC